MPRGTMGFDAEVDGALVDNAANLAALRRMWLDRSVINGEDLGPGDPGDFDNGAWHVGCHVVAGGGVRRAPDGRFLWLEISWDQNGDEYFASVTVRAAPAPRTVAIASDEGRQLLTGSTLLGFVEGTSLGRISAREARDPPERFNHWCRQQFDKPAESQQEGGRVWEHWCTLRDIRPTQPIASSVLRAYVTLVAALGGLFAPTVARGRRSYGHPRQLCAMVRAGFVSREAATWDTSPAQVPPAAEALLLQARAADALTAVEGLNWGAAPTYYMLARRIREWSPARAVTRDLEEFGP